MATSPGELVTVRLLEVPVQLRLRSQQHGEELVREMTLLTLRPDLASSVPDRLLEVANQLQTEYGPQLATAAAATDEAVEQGLESIPEIRYELPRTFAPFIRHLDELLREVDEFCSAGEHLLTLATGADVADFRAWSLSEVERQLAGGEPVPWPSFAGSH